MLEVDIDIRRLVAFLADETLEEGSLVEGIDRCDAENIADSAVGRRSALAEECPDFGRKTDDRKHGQEVRSVFHGADEIELVPNGL